MDNKKWPIAKLTFLALLCLQIVTVGLLMLISHLWGEEAYLKHVRGLMKSVAVESVQSVENLLQPAEHMIRSTRSLLEANVIDLADKQRLERYFFEEVRVNNNFSGMYFGWLNGDFLFVRHDHDSSQHPFMTKVIQAEASGQRITSEIYRTDKFVEQARVQAPTNFDPRERPWFESVGSSQHRWTEPYVHFTSQRPGITVSAPVLNHAGEPLGVLGLDIEISNLSYFLSKNDLSRNSSALIATGDMRAVAHTDFDAIMLPDPSDKGKHYLVSVKQMEDALSKKAIQTLENEGMAFVSDEVRTVSFEYNDETYHAVFHSYSKLGLKWTVVVTAPESDFIELIRTAQRWQVLTAVVASLIITLLAFLLALRFLRPVGELQETVLRNPLTGLYNRRALDTLGKDMAETAIADGEPVSVAMIDIDRFKSINDNYGHMVGDEVLVAVSQRMSQVLKKSDVLVRYGGEEFALLLVGTNEYTATQICERLRIAVSQSPIITEAGSISVTVSIGVHELSPNTAHFHQALSIADQALYSAKKNGRNQVCTVRDVAA